MSGMVMVRRGRLKKAAAALFSTAFIFLLIFVPGPAISGARRGLTICGESVIPSLFPFLVLSSFIIGSGLAGYCEKFFEPLTRRVFKLPGSAGAALILGAVGGYPVGAKAVAQLHEKGLLTKSQAERLLCIAINSSPAFIIGAVGTGFLGNPKAGLLLLAAHLGASASIGILMRPLAKADISEHGQSKLRSQAHIGNRKCGNFSYAFVSAVTGSAQSIIAISAFVVLFSALNSLLDSIGFTGAVSCFLSKIFPVPAGDTGFFSRVLTGILEVTNGCAAAAGSSGMAAVLLTAAVLGFSGLSVQFQVISMISDSGLSARLFILTRFLHIGFSVLYAFILFSLVPSAMPVEACVSAFAYNSSGLVTSFHSAPAVCAMLFICAMLLLSLAQI